MVGVPVSRLRAAITLLPLLLIGGAAVILFARGEPKADTDGVGERVRSRILLLGYLCAAFETDNGRFPRSFAELYYPVNYIESLGEIMQVDFSKVNQDPLQGNSAFVIVRLVSPDANTDYGIPLRGPGIQWAVASRSYSGLDLNIHDVIFVDRIPTPYFVPVATGDEMLPHGRLIALTADSARELLKENVGYLQNLLKQSGLE